MSKSIARGTLSITLANIFQYVLSAFFYVIVTQANVLTQEEVGIFSILTFFSSFFSLVTLMALPSALTKYSSENVMKDKYDVVASVQKTIIKLVFGFSAIGLVIVIILAPVLSDFFLNSSEFIFLIILNFIFAAFTNIMNLFRSALQGLYFFGKMAIITIVFVSISRFLAIFLGIINMGLMGVIIGYVIGALVAASLSVLFLRGKLPETKETFPIKPLLVFSIPLLLTSLASFFVQWADIVILTSLTHDLSLVGIYHIVVNSVGTFSIFYLPITTTVFPSISAEYGLKKFENINNIIKYANRFLYFVMIPVCIGLAITGSTALTVFYGTNYSSGSMSLAILSVNRILIALCLLYQIIFQAIGKTAKILKINIVVLILSLTLPFILVPLLSLEGAALARLITQILALSVTYYLLQKEIKFSLENKIIYKSIVSSLIFVPFLVILEITCSGYISSIQLLLIETLIGLGIYSLCLYYFKALTNQDFNLIKQAFPKYFTKFIAYLEKIMVKSNDFD